MSKVIIFYKYTDIIYPKQIQKWQLKLCLDLNLKGRIILAQEGINATVGGDAQSIDTYIEAMNEHELFKDIDFKEGFATSDCFEKLRIVVRPEIVSLGIDPNIVKYKDAGQYLTAQQAHELFNQQPKDLVIFDARNEFESKIGHFKGAKLAKIKYFRQLPKYIDENLQDFKDKKVIMYCTAGIRCERATAYLKQKEVAKEVYHIKGGIQRYVEQFPDGHFRGRNYVFDARVTVKINDDILSSCYICNSPYDDYTNCLNASCNKHFIACPNCIKQYENNCSKKCLELVKENKVKVRPKFKKAESNACSI